MKSIKDSGTKSIATFVATKRVYEPQSWIIVTPNNVSILQQLKNMKEEGDERGREERKSEVIYLTTRQ